MGLVQLFPSGGSGGSFEPGVVTTFPANVVPYINGLQETSYDANFTYQSANLGIGLSSALGARLHVKGANDSTGNALYVQSATNAKLTIGNGELHAINGATSAANNLMITGDLGITYSTVDSTKFIKFTSANSHIFDVRTGTISGGNGYPISIFRYVDGNPAIRFVATIGTMGMYFNGTDIQAYVASPGIEKDAHGGTVIRGFHSTTNEGPDEAKGAINFDVRGTAGANNGLSSGVNSYIYYTDSSFGQPYKAMRLRGAFAISSGTNSGTMLGISPTYNQTGGTSPFIGIDYDPTVTAILGVHYGALIRLGLSGFRLGSSLPTATVHIEGGSATANTAPIKINDGTLMTTPEDGAIERASTHLFHTKGTYRYQIDPDYDGLPDTDHSAVGHTTASFNSGATITVMDLCYMGSSSKWLLTDADAEATANGALAISLESKNDTQAMRVALPGSFVRDDSWNWTPGAMLYVDTTTAGGITATAPSGSGDVVRVVGWAVSADVIYFNPSTEYTVI